VCCGCCGCSWSEPAAAPVRMLLNNTSFCCASKNYGSKIKDEHDSCADKHKHDAGARSHGP
jgi:hypothetical protein